MQKNGSIAKILEILAQSPNPVHVNDIVTALDSTYERVSCLISRMLHPNSKNKPRIVRVRKGFYTLAKTEDYITTKSKDDYISEFKQKIAEMNNVSVDKVVININIIV